MGIIPAGSYANRNFCSHQLEINPSVDPVLIDLLADPQTSGGLLLSLPQSEASELVANLKSKGLTASAIIGYVLDKGRGKILVTP
jgi:selenide,water dikinase